MCSTSRAHDNNVSLFMCNFSRNSLSRISTLGADGGVGPSSLMLQGGFSPFLGYKTGMINYKDSSF